MNGENGNSSSPGPSAATKLGHQVRRTLLLVTVVVGVVAVYWIWERFHTQGFEVTVIAEPDPHQVLAGFPYNAADLLELMEFSARPSQSGPPLDLERHDDPFTWTFGASGDNRRSVKNQELRGVLNWRGSDAEGLSIPLSFPVDSPSSPGRYEVRLTASAVENFYEDATVTTSFKVTDQTSGAALPGLRLNETKIKAFTESQRGIYELTVYAATLLQLVQDQSDSLTFRITQETDDRAAERLSLSVPLAWLFQRPAAGESRVLAIEFVTEVDHLCPRATGLEPTRVRQDRWPDHLVITGEFLDRTQSASLRRRGREIACSILLKTPTHLELTPGSVPAPGVYEVSLASENCEATSGGRLEVVAPSTALRALPLAAAELERGSELALRWRRGSVSGPLAVEVSSPGGDGPWRSLAQAGAGMEHYTWPAIDLDPGSYKLRLRPVDSESAAASWDLSVTQPAELLVVLHFTDGKENWRVREAWVDGFEITSLEATGSHARIHLARGEHLWVAKGRDHIAYTGSFVVEPRHDFENTSDFDPIRLDRAESKRRD